MEATPEVLAQLKKLQEELNKRDIYDFHVDIYGVKIKYRAFLRLVDYSLWTTIEYGLITDVVDDYLAAHEKKYGEKFTFYRFLS